MSELPVVDCAGCGVCCLHMGFPAFNLTVDQLTDDRCSENAELSAVAQADLARWRAMPGDLQQQILRHMRDYRPPAEGQLDGPCSWLDGQTRLCRHHQHRPQVCRDFQIGSSGCLDWRRALATQISH